MIKRFKQYSIGPVSSKGGFYHFLLMYTISLPCDSNMFANRVLSAEKKTSSFGSDKRRTVSLKSRSVLS